MDKINLSNDVTKKKEELMDWFSRDGPVYVIIVFLKLYLESIS